MANYIVAGGSGFIGKHLCRLLLSENHKVYVLTTQKKAMSISNDGVHYVYWNPKEYIIDETFSLENCFVINLAGAGVADKRWTKERKQEILQSRVQSLETLFMAVEKKQIQIVHLASASAIGYYGDSNEICNETNKGDTSFLSMVCQQWEQYALKFSELNIPVSIVRIGIVMGREGGALKEFLKPLRFGIAAIPSNGKQVYSWVHIEDVCRIFYFVSSTQTEGVFNAVAPNPVTMNIIFEELIKHTKPFFFSIHAPSFMLKLMLGEMSVEILKSTHVSSKKIEQAGFEFQYKMIETCISSFFLKSKTYTPS